MKAVLRGAESVDATVAWSGAELVWAQADETDVRWAESTVADWAV